ncbi:MAG: carboxypeptidase-like regulatory domain-containing protein, partial [Planctomycetota bacterium]
MFRAVIGICVVSISILGYAEDAKPDPQKDAARIRRTAQNLLSSSEALRERAAGSLVKIGVDAVDELEALKAKRPKVAERVDAVLEKILAKALRLVDATGKPISSARVSGDYEKRVLRGPGTILNNPNGRTRPARRTGPVRASFEARTSRSGWFDRPEGLTIHRAFKVDVKHAIYGSAVGFAYFDPKTRPSETHVIRVPLVSPESEEYQRACRGRVVNETGEPIAGATLVCQYVRTTGEGLINGVDVQRVRSGSDGRFAFY